MWPDVALFYTTADFDGYFDESSVPLIQSFIRERLGIDAALWSCHQVHGIDRVRATRNPEPGTRNRWKECASCDALWTDETGVALSIKVADCLPVTMIDSEHRVLVNIHSGWRGTAKAITARTLETLQQESSFNPASARAYLGPSIRQCCFEVGEEVVQQFGGEGEGAKYVDRARGPRPHFDLVSLTRDVLTGSGVTEVYDSGLCTRCDGSLFHSYRRNGPSSGRNLAIVAQ